MTTPDEQREPQTPPPRSSGDYYRPSSPLGEQERYTTPRSTISRYSKLSTAAKEHVDEVIAGGARCLITQDLEPVDYCHVLARATSYNEPVLMRQLEVAWGVEPHELCVDTSQNIVNLRADFHRTFDKGNWALIPSHDVLQAILSRASTLSVRAPENHFLKLFPSKKDWLYNFCHFRGNPELIVRSNPAWIRPDPKKPKPPDDPTVPRFSVIESPFDDVSFRSHVHPYFAICNVAMKHQMHVQRAMKAKNKAVAAGRNVADLPEPMPELRGSLLDRVGTCSAIFGLWAPGWVPREPESEPDPEPDPPLPDPGTPTARSTGGSPSDHTYPRRRSRSPDDADAPNNAYTQGGGAIKRMRGASSSASAHSLQTPSTSQGHAGHVLDRAAQADLLDLVCHPPNIERWVEAVGSDKFDANSIVAGSPGAQLALEQYGKEHARVPPATPWIQWRPGWLDAAGDAGLYS